MTSYEYNWYRWLRRELATELGMSRPRVGRRQRFSPQQQRQFYTELRAAAYGKRFLVYDRWRKEHKVGMATLSRIAGEQRRRHMAELAARFHNAPHNQTLQGALA